MVGTVERVTVPLRVRLLNVITVLPFTVPAPVKLTVPVAPAKADEFEPLFVMVPEAVTVSD